MKNYFFLLVIILFSCTTNIDKDKPPLNENHPEELKSLVSYLERDQYNNWPDLKTPVLKWSEIKNKFPSQIFTKFEFTNKGQPLNNLNNLVKVDSSFFNEITSKNKRLNDWKDYLEMYFYSSFTYKENEYRVLLIIQEYDGTEYTFYLFQTNEDGFITYFLPIANSWEAAECIGFTNCEIDTINGIVFSQKTTDCYDQELHQKIIQDTSFIFKLQ